MNSSFDSNSSNFGETFRFQYFSNLSKNKPGLYEFSFRYQIRIFFSISKSDKKLAPQTVENNWITCKIELHLWHFSILCTWHAIDKSRVEQWHYINNSVRPKTQLRASQGYSLNSATLSCFLWSSNVVSVQHFNTKPVCVFEFHMDRLSSDTKKDGIVFKLAPEVKQLGGAFIVE